MAVPYIFASTLGGSNIPLQWLDDDFAYLTSSPSFSGNVTITGTLGVGGAVNFSSTLNVAGITTLSNDLNVSGSSSFTGGATFSSSITFDSKTITGTTGTGNFVLSVSPTVTSATLVAPALGTPTSGNLANCTNLPVSGIDGLGAGVANFLSVPSSSNLAAAVTGETGTGALVFGTNPVLGSPTINTATINTSTLNTPTLTSAVLGTPTSGTLTNCTGLPLTTGITGVLPVANGGTGISSLTTGYIPFGGTTTFSSDSALFWDNTGKRLGVGTSVPVYKFDVAGDARVQRPAGAGWGIVTNTTTLSNLSGFYSDGSNNFEMAVRDASGVVTGIIRSAGNSWVNLSTGNFGIGTSTPAYKLDVAGSARISGLATIAGPLFVGPQDTSTTFQGMRLTNGADSSSSQTVSYIDATNNLGFPDSNIFFTHETNGSSYIAFSTTPAGARNADRRVQKVVISPDGQTLVTRTPGVAGWGIVAKSQDLSTTIPNESGIYFDGLNNPEFSAYDSSGVLKVRWQTASSSANLVDGLPAYVCRAWVNFNGVGAASIRANGNISSVTYNSTGIYTINFLTQIADTNYSVTGVASYNSGAEPACVMVALATSASYVNKSTSQVQIYTTDTNGIGTLDCFDVNVAIFR